jgi:hypothetical protein
MNPNEAARGALVLVKALENPQETDFERLPELGRALSDLAARISSARQTQLLALSNVLLDEFQDVTAIARIGGLLNVEELAEALKWPFGVGKAQKLVFAELEKKIKDKIGRPLDEGIEKFVEQVDSLGINGLDLKFLNQPAKRPKVEDALKELETIRVKIEKNPPSPTPPLGVAN